LIDPTRDENDRAASAVSAPLFFVRVSRARPVGLAVRAGPPLSPAAQMPARGARTTALALN